MNPVNPSVENNIAHFFLHKPIEGGCGANTAIQYGDARVSYMELQALVGQVGNGLRAHGVEPGQVVMIAQQDGPKFAATLLGICGMGAIAVMVNPSDPGKIPALAAEVGARLVIGTDGLGGAVPFDHLVAGMSTQLDIHPVMPDDDAIYLYSGGTTGGRQKIVRQRHGSFIEVTKYLAQDFLGYNSNDITLSVPRLFFGYATGGNLLFPLSVGGTSVLSSEWPTPESIFAQVRRHRPTILINTPAMIIKMLDWAEAHPGDCDLSSIRFMTSAGEKLPRSVYDRWVRVFPTTPLCDGLGFAEHWYFISFNRPGSIRPGTVGTIIPPQEVKICDGDGNLLSDGEQGFLHVRGPAMANGYLNNPQATADAFRDGWFRPGDQARIDGDEDGQRRLVYLGREGNTFKVSGRWVDGDAVTDCLLQHPAVAECIVLPHEDPNTQLTKPAAFVVLHPGSSTNAETLQAYVVANMPAHNCPQRFIFLFSLPRTSLGKVNRRALADML